MQIRRRQSEICQRSRRSAIGTCNPPSRYLWNSTERGETLCLMQSARLPETCNRQASPLELLEAWLELCYFPHGARFEYSYLDKKKKNHLSVFTNFRTRRVRISNLTDSVVRMSWQLLFSVQTSLFRRSTFKRKIMAKPNDLLIDRTKGYAI